MEHNFGEKKQEVLKGEKVDVWQTPKYLETKEKAISLIESDQYKGILKDGDFWILMNGTKSGKMAYTGLIISHNACLKINDTLPQEKKFKPDCFRWETETYNNGLVGIYNDGEIFEFGEVSPSNCKNDYPYAMLLKRCFDRVVLKKSGIAQWGIYSDSEADEFKEKYEEKEESNCIDNNQWAELNRMYTKEQIKEMYKELNISNGKNMPVEYFKLKKEEYDAKFAKEHPDKEFY